VALDRALEVFWRKGYEGASLPDLTRAMGINRPSLYAAFGNKEALFRKALARYMEGPAAYVGKALNEPTAHAVAERLLEGAANLLTEPGKPRGCLVVQAALVCGEASDAVRRELMAHRAAGQDSLRQRFERAGVDGDLSSDVDYAALARYVVTVLHGMAVQAASGASRDDLRRVVEIALRAWPS